MRIIFAALSYSINHLFYGRMAKRRQGILNCKTYLYWDIQLSSQWRNCSTTSISLVLMIVKIRTVFLTPSSECLLIFILKYWNTYKIKKDIWRERHVCPTEPQKQRNCEQKNVEAVIGESLHTKGEFKLNFFNCQNYDRYITFFLRDAEWKNVYY